LAASAGLAGLAATLLVVLLVGLGEDPDMAQAVKVTADAATIAR
jgi:hypothetical protein